MVSKRDELYNAALLDSRPMPEVTYDPPGMLVVGHHYKLEKVGQILLPTGDPLQKQFDTRRVKVLAVGPKVEECKVGDVVLISDSAPAEVIVHRGHTTVVFRGDHILGVERTEIEPVNGASS